jgi:hypothetical protein
MTARLPAPSSGFGFRSHGPSGRCELFASQGQQRELSCAIELVAEPKKETDVKKPHPHGKVGIRATALETDHGRARTLLTRVPAVIVRLRDAVRPRGGNWATRSLARLLAGTGRPLRERAQTFEIETTRWQKGDSRNPGKADFGSVRVRIARADVKMAP